MERLRPKCSISMEMAAKQQPSRGIFSPLLLFFHTILSPIECTPGLSRFRHPPPPPPIISFARSTSFHLLDYRACCFVRGKKQCPGTIFGWKQNSFQRVFIERLLLNRLFCNRNRCFDRSIDRSKEKFDFEIYWVWLASICIERC